MELKDVILSTLAEMEDVKQANDDSKPVNDLKKIVKTDSEPKKEPKVESDVEDEQNLSHEMQFLTSIRERMLVLFEGFQAPNNANIEAKIDMTLNFLEYVLVTIDSRIKELEKKDNL
jgi:CO dehydrogenase/acetyl-CoA synthase beta subunit